MKKTGIFLFTIYICTNLTTSVLFAQAKPVPANAPRIIAQTTNPTPTTATTQPTDTPAPTVTTTQVTAAPTPQTTAPTAAPEQIHQTQAPSPTATPTPVPPTPTLKPKPLVVTTLKKPPSSPISSIITVPFNLVANSLPQSYYDDQGLSPITTKVLLGIAFLFLMSGTLLLAWPTLVRSRNRFSAHTLRERSAIPYLDLAGKA
jgi:hypothetical protein